MFGEIRKAVFPRTTFSGLTEQETLKNAVVVIKHTCDIVKVGFDTDQKLFFPETFRLLQRPTSLTCRMQTITSELSLICTYK